MRVTTAFNKMLAVPGATVAGVAFTPEGVVVTLRRRSRRLRCPCGTSTGSTYDRRVRRWRHLDLGACKLHLEAEIRRLRCPRCERVRTEEVPWARPGARLTRDLEDLIAFMAQRMDKTTVARLLRVSWEAVARAVIRVVDEGIDDARLDELYRIGVDEVSYRKGHRYLTVVADHDREGAVVWAAEGKKAEVLKAFYDQLGEERKARLEAVSLDMGSAYAQATREEVSHAAQCIDPFHVVKAANDAIDKTRRGAWNTERRTNPPPKRPRGRPPKGSAPPPLDRSRPIKHTRWALLKDPDRLSEAQLEVLDRLRRQRSVLYRCWQLKEALHDLYRLRRPQDAPLHLDWWLAWACRSRIPAFVKLARTIRKHRDGILAAIRLGLELEAGGSQLEDPAHQPPGLRPPLRHGPDRDDLPLLRRDHGPATHGKVRRPRIRSKSSHVALWSSRPSAHTRGKLSKEADLTRTRTWLAIVWSVGLIGSVFVTSGPAMAAFPGANGKIAFEFDGVNAPNQIYTMNADGSGKANITNSSSEELEPAWSADGQKLLFSSDRHGDDGEIYVMNADGTGQTRLTNNPAEDVDGGWSPDGTKIAFQTTRDGNDEIYVMNADGSSPTRLTNNAVGDYDPVWSPDGTKIAFESDGESGNDQVFVMNADGSGRTRLTNTTADDTSVAWSPDGAKLVFDTDRDGNSEIYVMNADGSSQTRITNNSEADFEPAWSPDGTKIVFSREPSGGEADIWVMNPDGSGATKLTSSAPGDFEADWQPIPQSAPETTILKGPKKKTTDRTPTFTFESSVPGSTFECKLDSKPFASCTSSAKYKKQGFGKHTFQVRAIAGGATDPTPAKKSWRVIEKD